MAVFLLLVIYIQTDIFFLTRETMIRLREYSSYIIIELSNRNELKKYF